MYVFVCMVLFVNSSIYDLILNIVDRTASPHTFTHPFQTLPPRRTRLDQVADKVVRERDGRRGVALHVAQLLLERLRVEEARDDVPGVCLVWRWGVEGVG